MRIAHIPAIAAAVCLALAPGAAAGQKGKGGGAPKTTAHGPSTHAQTPPPQTTHGNPHATTPKAQTAHGNPHTTTPKTSTPTATKGNPHTSSGTTTTKAHNPRTTTSRSGAGSTETSTTTPNPIALKLEGKPLGSRIEKMLPANMTLNTASAGFRNQGQFIAAVHVSQNLGIPFADLKATMLGTPLPGSTTAALSPMSLGQAIQQLKPFANATTETARAETQATSDLRTTSTSPSIATTKSRKRGK
jgi:hypothetical protein